MPVITFTPTDLLAVTIIPKGYYRAVVKEVSGATASGSGKSVSYYVTFEVVDGPFAGKQFKVAFNSASTGRSILGNAQFVPLAEMALLYTAATGNPVNPAERLAFDTDEMMDRELDLGVSQEMVEGEIKNGVFGYLPAGKSQQKPAF